MARIGFDALVKKLIAEGHTEDSAKRVAADIGRRKYGRAGLAALAAAGRAKADVKRAAKS